MKVLQRSRRALLLSGSAFALLLAACQPPGPRSLLDGEKHIREGDFQQAVKDLKLASELMPENPQVWNHLGLAHHGAGNSVEAAAAYHRALTIDRNLHQAYFNLGNLYLEESKLPEAIAALSTYTAAQPQDPIGWTKLAAAQVRTKQFDDAERSILTGLKINAKNPELHNNYGLVHLHRKRPREALQSFTTALQHDPQYAPALLNQAIIVHHHLSNKPAALERYKLFLALSPNSENADAVRVTINELERELAPGIASTPPPQPALKTNPPPQIPQTSIPPPALAASSPTNMPPVSAPSPSSNQPSPASAVASRPSVYTNSSSGVVVNLQPRSRPSAPPASTPPVAKNLAAVPASPPPTNHPPKVEDVIKEPVITVALPGEPDFKAARDVKDVRNTPPQTTPSRSQLALAKSPSKTSPPAVSSRQASPGLIQKINPANWFGNDPQNSPSNSLPLASKSPQAQGHRERIGQERQFFESVPPLEPAPREVPDAPRYPFRKNLRLPEGNRDQAEKLFQQGAGMHQDKRLGAAIELYKQAVKIDPSHFDSHYNLALAAYQLKDYPLALSASESAVLLKPGSIDARFNFALTLRQANYFVDASNQLRELLVDSPGEARAHFLLAAIYQNNLDQPFLARRHYQRLLELQPHHPEAANIRYWLANNP